MIDKENVFKAVPFSNHNPAGRTAIAAKLTTDPSDADLVTTSRHLRSLVADGRVEKIGDKRGATYKRKAVA
jgi:hypothetical protein